MPSQTTPNPKTCNLNVVVNTQTTVLITVQSLGKLKFEIFIEKIKEKYVFF